MRRFKVKVCGITRRLDADRVAELGGDMIGFVFYRRSPRFVTQTQARQISLDAAPTLDRVGVFVDEKIDTVLRMSEKVRLSWVQLHGNEPASHISKLQKAGYRVIKAFSVTSPDGFKKLERSRADMVMIDRITANRPGGSGLTFDWSLRPRKRIPNLILAGGVTVRNLARGMSLYDPLVVDVNSGVESSPGVKSARKLRQFFAACDQLRYGG